MSEEFTTAEVAKALGKASKENRNSMKCELRFANKVISNPGVLDARLGRIKYVCAALGVKPGGVVLDVGAGVGVNSILSLLCGVGEVHAVECDPQRLDSARLVVEALKVADRIHLHGEDVLKLDLPARSVDAAFSFELLEHISDTGALYRQFAAWLKEGGRAYGRTGANGRNLVYRRTFRKEWDMNDEEYVPVRAAAIEEVAPDASKEDVTLLVERTRGALMAEVKRVATEFKSRGSMPPPLEPRAPRDPVTGQYQERLLDPFETIRTMNAQGFRTILLAPNFENLTTVNPLLSRAQKAVGALIRATHPVSLFMAPWLEFLSQREPASS